jgi:hypothetical protein
MRVTLTLCTAAILQFSGYALGDEVSLERGQYLAIIGGCHDCHTEGYRESGGKIDLQKALRGNHVGFQGSWGTTFPSNIPQAVSGLSEDGFARYASHLKSRPPMPWYSLRAMKEADLRSLYRYIKSLGEAGAAAPQFAAPGARPRGPFVVLDPPQPPPPCKSDLECDLGQKCAAEPRQCVPL